VPLKNKLSALSIGEEQTVKQVREVANRRNRIMKKEIIQIFLIWGCVLLWGMPAAYSQTTAEPKERIELGAEGKSIQMEVQPEEEYTYIPGERRDPFVSLLRRGGESDQYGDELTPLQRVDLGELKLVGVVKKPEGNTALIQTPDGKGYFLRQGVQVGKNEGIVDKILEDKVIIKEKKADFLGQITVSEFVLTLKKEEGSR
jgi:type IV pilus assembly protein PilP